MKKSYTLLITIILVSLFSYLSIVLLEIKSLRYTNLTNQYLYIQAKNHKEFFKTYINSIDLKNINHLEIENENFNIEAIINKINNDFIVDIYVNSKKYQISLYEQIKQ